MLFLRFLLLLGSFGLLASAAGVVLYDIFLAFELNRLLRRRDGATDRTQPEQSGAVTPPIQRSPLGPRPGRVIRLNMAAKLVLLAAVTALGGISIVVVPD